jgi:hypothetical protein
MVTLLAPLNGLLPLTKNVGTVFGKPMIPITAIDEIEDTAYRAMYARTPGSESLGSSDMSLTGTKHELEIRNEEGPAPA